MTKKLILISTIIIGLCIACQPVASPDDQATTPAQESTLSPSATPHPTATVAPKATPTVAPSATPVPEQKNTPLVSDNLDGIIAFYSDRDGNPEIYTMHADGSNVTRLTNDPGFDDSPALSPDGTQIAFLTARHDPSPSFPDLKYEIYMMGINGSNPHRLTETDATEDHPAWSPDGDKIIFDADYDGDRFYEIYTMNVDGSDVTRLTANAANDQFADWSPDGMQIAFSSDRNGNWDIFVMEADGSNQRALTDSPDWELFPAWSPDGTQIAFNGLVPRSRNTDVFVMQADGSNVRQLADSSRFDENPVWSPDGNLIAFQTARDGNFELYVMAPDGSNQRPLAAHPADELWPSWEPATSQSETRYLGQTPPGDDVEVFAPGIVSIEEGKEYKITISPDAQEIFFTRRTPNGRNDRIWYARLQDGVLATPELAPFAYDCLEMDPSFTPDGNRVYYNSRRPLPGETTLSTRFNIWFVERSGDGWSESQFVGPPLNDERPVYFSFANDNTLYFTNSNPREIRYAEWIDGQYTKGQRLPAGINDLPDVAHPAIAPDESYIVVDSYVQKGGALVGSLVISFMKADGSWTEAISMAEVLKATATDIYASPRISLDGKYLFFEKYLPATDQADIYWVSTQIIETLKPAP